MATLPATPGPDETEHPVERPRGAARHRPLRGPPARPVGRRARPQRREVASMRDRRAPAADIARHPVQRLRAAAAPRPHRGGTGAAAGLPPGLPGRPRHHACSARPSAPSPTPRTSAATATPPSAWNATRLRYNYLAGDVDRHRGQLPQPRQLPRPRRPPARPGLRQPPHRRPHLRPHRHRGRMPSIDRRPPPSDLREFGADAMPPADVADLCRQIGDIPGTEPARPHRDSSPPTRKPPSRHSATSSRRPKNWRSLPRPRPAPTNPETPLGAPAFTPGRACRLHTGPGVPVSPDLSQRHGGPAHDHGILAAY